MQEALANPKIEVMLGHEPRAFRGEQALSELEVEELAAKKRKVLKTDGVFVFIGMVPRTDLLAKYVPLAPGGYVETNEAMATRVPGLFVAGDIRVEALPPDHHRRRRRDHGRPGGPEVPSLTGRTRTRDDPSPARPRRPRRRHRPPLRPPGRRRRLALVRGRAGPGGPPARRAPRRPRLRPGRRRGPRRRAGRGPGPGDRRRRQRGDAGRGPGARRRSPPRALRAGRPRLGPAPRPRERTW